MKILRAICAPGRTGFYFDDQQAIKAGAVADGFTYRGAPQTPGFSNVRQAGESISILLVLEDGQIAWGDCAAVQYAGVGGRDPLFLAKELIPFIQKKIFPRLVGREVSSFRPLAEEVEAIDVKGRPLHSAIRYGLSQTLLDAAAKAQKSLMCEVIAKEYDIPMTGEEVPIFTQSGDDRYEGADKMILKGVQALPHGLINNAQTKLGPKGEQLLTYITWLRERILELRPDDNTYCPTLHLDVYGTLGQIFGPENAPDIADYLSRLSKAAAPFPLRIEGPIDAGNREGQVKALAALTALVDARGIPVELVSDEWCNTLEDIRHFVANRAGHMVQIKAPDLGGIGNAVEAILHCKANGVGAYLGGSCNETDRSAQVCVHLAMAAKPDLMLAKPGHGVDEGYMVVYNEMQRIRAILAEKEGRSS